MISEEKSLELAKILMNRKRKCNESNERIGFGSVIKSIVTELNYINEYESADVQITDCYRRKFISIKFVTKEIILENKNFGKFLVNMNFLIGLGKFSIVDPVTIQALNPQVCKINSLLTHPNIKNNALCIGDGKIPYQNALKEFRFGDAADIITSLLNTVSDDPYCKIENWDGYKCNNCGTESISGLHSCFKCNLDYCTACKIKCNYCGSYSHEGCIKICDHCNKNECVYCSYEIDNNNIVHKCLTCRCKFCLYTILKNHKKCSNCNCIQ